jgi:RNA recognition motif-containing protein
MPKSFAFVEFTDFEEASKAKEALDRSDFNGKMVQPSPRHSCALPCTYPSARSLGPALLPAERRLTHALPRRSTFSSRSSSARRPR